MRVMCILLICVCARVYVMQIISVNLIEKYMFRVKKKYKVFFSFLITLHFYRGCNAGLGVLVMHCVLVDNTSKVGLDI